MDELITKAHPDELVAACVATRRRRRIVDRDWMDQHWMHVMYEPEPEYRTDAGLSRDMQLYDAQESEVITMENAVLRAAASKACAECIGHCCLAFTISGGSSIEEFRQKVAKLQAEADAIENRAIMLEFYHYPITEPSDDMASLVSSTRRPLPEIYERIAWAQWVVDNTVQIIRKGHENHGDMIASCLRYDQKTRRCTIYEDRPTMCRTYLCGSSIDGTPPPAGQMMSDHIPDLFKQIRNAQRTHHEEVQ